MSDHLPAVVVLAHDKPRHLRRLIAALAPLPMFLHIDATTPDVLHRELVRDLPDRVRLLPRLAAGWARFELVEAEISGYRAALEQTDADHVILMSGADYPLAATAAIIAELAQHRGQSLAMVRPLPVEEWGPLGGYDRLWFRQRPWGRRRLVLPIPRRVPADLEPAGGSQMKILCREDAALVVSVADHRPDLMSFFRTCWIPDELMVPTILNSPRLSHRVSTVLGPTRWVIDWGSGRIQSPHWLTRAHLPELHRQRQRTPAPALFARKFHDDSAELVELIDTELRSASVT